MIKNLFNIFKILIIFSLLFPTYLGSVPIKWSSYQGKKNFQQAKEHCKSLNQRLPTIDELTSLPSGTKNTWVKSSLRFWAVNKKLNDNNTTYLAINIKNDSNEYHTPESQIGVFCANVTEESAELDVIRELVENNASESEIQKARADSFANKFGKYQGYLDWDQANRKCKSIGMKLPTLDELKKAYELGITKSWQKDGRDYWSSTPDGDGDYYAFDVYNGLTFNFTRSERSGVRCRR